MTKRYTWPLLLAVALAAGCAPPPSAALPPVVVAVPGQGGVAAIARLAAGGRQLLAVQPWGAADIDHVVLALHEGAAATPLVTKRIEGADLGKTIRLDGLKRETSYRVVLTAFTDAERIDDGEADAASCTTAFATTAADTVDAGTLALKLRDRPDGVGAGPGGETKTSGSLVAITAGGQTGSGTEGLSLVGFQVVGTLLGNGTAPSSVGPLATAKIASPTYAAVDAQGGIYVADDLPRKIRYIDPAQTEVTHFTGLGTNDAAAGGSLAEANFYNTQPFTGLAYAPGALYALQVGTLWKIAPLDATGQVTMITLSKPVNGNKLVVGPDGAIYVATSSKHCVHRIDPATGTVTVAAGVEASTGGLSDGAVASAKLKSPSAIAFDGPTMYIADAGNRRIRKLASGSLSTLAGSDTAGLGDGTAAAATFTSPRDLVFANGRLYVVDVDDVAAKLLLRAVTTDGVVTTLAGGDVGFLDASTDPADARFGDTVSLTPHPDGYLLICDTDNRRVRRFSY